MDSLEQLLRDRSGDDDVTDRGGEIWLTVVS
jgi:hypothetical protein